MLEEVPNVAVAVAVILASLPGIPRRNVRMVFSCGMVRVLRYLVSSPSFFYVIVEYICRTTERSASLHIWLECSLCPTDVSGKADYDSYRQQAMNKVQLVTVVRCRMLR